MPRRRPAARGQRSTHSTNAIEDCVHYCSPGPIDTWSTLLHNLLSSREPVWMPRPERLPRIYDAIDNQSWISTENVAHRLESFCAQLAVAEDPRCGQALHSLAWWPYPCTVDPKHRSMVTGCVDHLLPRLAALASTLRLDDTLDAAVTTEPGCSDTNTEAMPCDVGGTLLAKTCRD